MPVNKYSSRIRLFFLLITASLLLSHTAAAQSKQGAILEGAYNPLFSPPAAAARAAVDWTPLPDAIEPRVEGHSAYIDGKIYVFGGFQTEDIVPTDQNEVYDLATNAWSTFAPLPVPNTHVGSAEADGKVWIAGGFALIGYIQTVDLVWIYDPVTDTFTDGPPLPAPRAGGALVRLGRKLHYISGLINRNDNTGDHFVLDLDEPGGPQTWTTAAPMPDPRDHFSAVTLGGKIYAIGGQFGHDIDPVDTNLLHAYDPVTDSWTRKADLPYIRSHFEPGTVVVDGKILIAGGRSGTANCVDDITLYDPVTDAWSEVFDMPYCALAPSMKVVEDEMFVTHGGVVSVLHPTTEANKTDYTRSTSSVLSFTTSSYAFTMAPNETASIEAVLWTLSDAASYNIDLAGLPGWISTVSKSAGKADHAGDEIDITINTAGLAPGFYSHTLTATANGYDDADLTLQVTVLGDGEPVLVFSPSSIDLGLVPAGYTTAQTVTLTNEGSGTATFDAAGLDVSNLELSYTGYPVDIMMRPAAMVTQLGPGESTEIDFYVTLLGAGEVTGTASHPYFSAGDPASVSLSFSGTGAGTRIARINAGGNSIDPGVFDDWDADQYFEGGNTYTNPEIDAILGTLDQEPYLSERSAGTNLGSFAYRIPVPKQAFYITRLHFSENYFGAPGGTIDFVGRRVFDVNFEGGPVELDDYDIAADVGPVTAVVKSFTREVLDGVLDIEFSASADQPKVSAIEVFMIDQRYHQTFEAGWNLIGLTRAPDTPPTYTDHYSNIFTDISVLFAPYLFEENAYVESSEMKAGLGYWLKTDKAGIQTYPTEFSLNSASTLVLKTGWNLLSTTCENYPVDLLGLNQFTNQSAFGYDSHNGYSEADSLIAGKAYWVKADFDFPITWDCFLASSSTQYSTSQSHTQKTSNPTYGASTLKFTDARGYSRTLYIDTAAAEADDFQLPPTPPRAIPDVRFLNSSSLMTADEALVRLQAMEAPLTVALEGDGVSMLNLQVKDGDGWRVLSTLAAGQEVVLNEPALDRLLISKNAATAEALPDAFNLQGAYPNPFQSTASITFDAPDDGAAYLEVYDMLGKRVLQTAEEPVSAGAQRTLKLEGQSLASGAYMYRLVLETAAGVQSATGRVVVVR